MYPGERKYKPKQSFLKGIGPVKTQAKFFEGWLLQKQKYFGGQ